MLPIETVPTIKPKNQLEFVVGVIALLFYPTLLFLPVVLLGIFLSYAVAFLCFFVLSFTPPPPLFTNVEF